MCLDSTMKAYGDKVITTSPSESIAPASSLYRLLALTLGNDYETAKSKKIFRDTVDATGFVVIRGKKIIVIFQKSAHNPYLPAADFDKVSAQIPWLG
jgi:hypothetical protein